MTEVETITRNLATQQFPHAELNLDALELLYDRLASAARRKDQPTLSYSDLVKGVQFHLPTRSFKIRTFTPFARRFISDVLDFLSARSFNEVHILDPAILLWTEQNDRILVSLDKSTAPELPEKLEQTVFCELDPQQRKLYDELRDHYRQSLLTRITRDGLNKSKIHVLEALLRLRQAACHPALVDRGHMKTPSAKLDALLQQLEDVLAEGHKALVFSQFTSLLAIVRNRLDEKKVVYEYLDGKTRHRQARVNRFQTDRECKLFLISLKAGGVGLNLTAADYVFLLDPWWNPAVEAQAIDRTHRIGQDKRVFTYRLIAKDTVEEKVLQLQQSKRDLADAILNEDNSVLANMGREELELLLS